MSVNGTGFSPTEKYFASTRFKLKRVRERIARALMDRGSRETRALYPRWKNFDRAFSKAFFTSLEDLTRVKILSLAEGGSKFRPPCFAGFFYHIWSWKFQNCERVLGTNSRLCTWLYACRYQRLWCGIVRMMDSLPVLFNSIVLSLSLSKLTLLTRFW